jgi:apolipoprotein D and lipocalin family protein
METMVPRIRRWRCRAALLAALSLMLACGNGLQAVPAAPAAALDLARYQGRWYVIARAPADEPHPRAAYFEYRALADGAIDGVYASRASFEGEAVTKARPAKVDPQAPAKWRVRTGWLSTDEQWVLYVSPDYRFAIEGVPSRGAAWILAREPVIPEWSYAGLLARLAVQGYDVSQFRRVPQKPEQVGRPGFE